LTGKAVYSVIFEIEEKNGKKWGKTHGNGFI
jgi:hypothetical protein